MKINKHKTTIEITDELDNVISKSITTAYALYPEEGKALKNKITGYITSSCVGVSNKLDISNYEEIELDNN